MILYFVEKVDVLETLRKLEEEHRNVMAESIIYRQVINEAIDRIKEIPSFEYIYGLGE